MPEPEQLPSAGGLAGLVGVPKKAFNGVITTMSETGGVTREDVDKAYNPSRFREPFMPFVVRPHTRWQLRSRTLALGERTLLMGILNVTPDSFSDGNRYFTASAALDHGLALLDEGADVLDLGGESTRPNATPLDAAAEQARVLPVLRALLRARPSAVLSVDTYHASTARAAIEEGAEIINDVSGLLWDPLMPTTLAEQRPGAVLMHTRGAPRLWSSLPPLPPAEVLPLVVSGLTHTLALARAAGVERASIVLDPGFGFGKLGDENFVLLGHFAQLRQFGLPLLAGVSRKRFLLHGVTAPTDALRLETTCAANVAAILGGAHILRVHDVPAARTAAGVADKVLAGAA